MSEINLPLKDLKIKSLTQDTRYSPLFLLTDKTRLNYIESAFAKANAKSCFFCSCNLPIKPK